MSKAICIELTDKQFKQLAPLLKEIEKWADKDERGLLLGQVAPEVTADGDDRRVFFECLDHKKSAALIKAVSPERYAYNISMGLIKD